jgi:hypothetical protein
MALNVLVQKIMVGKLFTQYQLQFQLKLKKEVIIKMAVIIKN